MYIYKTTNLVNNKIYIGQTTRKNTENYIGSGKILKQAISKYGKDNFKKEILEYCENKEILDIREKYWISYYNTMDKNIGYNICDGGQGGDVRTYMTEEQFILFRKKISEGCKGKKLGVPLTEKNKIGISKGLQNYYKNGGISPSKGKVTSDETKQKISNKLKNREFTDEWKNKLKESRSKLDISGKNNPMYGKSVYSVWVEKYGIEEANKRLEQQKEKLRIAAYNNKIKKIIKLLNLLN